MNAKLTRLLNITLLLFFCLILSGCRMNESDNAGSNIKAANYNNHEIQIEQSYTMPTNQGYPNGFIQTSSIDTGISLVSKLKIASTIDQLICVIGNGNSHVTVTYNIKDANGIWHQQFKTTGDCGYKGITYHKKEGDKKTPAGLYTFTTAFGIKPNPGTNLSYRRVTKYDYWIDDTDSPYYNTWINSKEIPGKYKSEHLIEETPAYNYALNINYNPDCEPELGSAIFLHCKAGSGRTAGCIAISEKYMKILLKKIDDSAMILIVPSEKYLAKY